MDKYIKFDWSELDSAKDYEGLNNIVSLIMKDNVVSSGDIFVMKEIKWDELRSTLSDEKDLECFDEVKEYIISQKI